MKIVYVWLVLLFLCESTHGVIANRLSPRDVFGQEMNTRRGAPNLATLANQTNQPRISESQDLRSHHSPARVLPFFVGIVNCWYSFVVFACVGHLPTETWDVDGDPSSVED